MTAWFADTFLFMALGNKRDAAHGRAVSLMRDAGKRLVTTAWVLTELADGLCAASHRAKFVRLYERLRSDPRFEIVPPDAERFEQGVRLYGSRPDKDWSLTDCTSFVVMRERGITEALTGDRHFEQAGFKPLLA